jgi:D-lactate dehydrogenase (cytochrome)
MNGILPFNEEYEKYLRDESRLVGSADSIAFPRDEKELRGIVSEAYKQSGKITVQGGLTGLTGGAVPKGGLILNLSKMDKVTGMSGNAADGFRMRVMPGVMLIKLREMLSRKEIDTDGWSAEALEAYAAFRGAREQMFTPDPTETTATIGGMSACNASGALSYGYGPVRSHITALRVVFPDGDAAELPRGRYRAELTPEGVQTLTIKTLSNRTITARLPSYEMPRVKNATGYYVAPNMDAVDLFIGMGGTLGIISEIEISLIDKPREIYSALCFFKNPASVLNFVHGLRADLAVRPIKAIEYFDENSLRILNDAAKKRNTVGISKEGLSEEYKSAVYIEIHAETEEEGHETLSEIGEYIEAVGEDLSDTWLGDSPTMRTRMLQIRHAIPESVNLLIDERRKKDPGITKLASDMAVPSDVFPKMMEIYKRTLSREKLDYAIWGHIGNDHVHVNILPNSMEEYERGRALSHEWADYAIGHGGTISAEHGIGRLKTDFLSKMYGSNVTKEMRELKSAYDPKNLLNPNVLFNL